ncbi:TPA: hypothetical protein N0F65_005329 [Lagenidium giganteum]|uniref:Uncharacterized protein n=1 Tax=Lagenidium giganteum TaxID=4803 RepID=A0AAV2YT72_9STRA|nr:TPA: hypothetical protein N0F65_005329 [Lagenidium giganteum]
MARDKPAQARELLLVRRLFVSSPATM